MLPSVQRNSLGTARGFGPVRRMLEWTRNELADAYLIPPFRRYEEALEILS